MITIAPGELFKGWGMTVAAIDSGKLDIGRVISQTFGVIGRNFVTFGVLGIVLSGLPLMAFSFAQHSFYSAEDQTFSALSILWNGAGGFAMVITSAILQGTLIYATVQDMNGAKPSIGDSLATGLRAFLPLLGVSILFGLGAALGFVLLIVPGLMVLCAWSVAIPALIADRTGVFGAFSRSADLTRGNRWRIFGLGLIIWIAMVILGIALVQVLGFNVFGETNPAAIQAATLSPTYLIANLVTNVLSSVVSSTGIAVLYVELRHVREGAGPQWLADIFS